MAAQPPFIGIPVRKGTRACGSDPCAVAERHTAEAEPSANKGPALPKIAVVAPKKKASRPAPSPAKAAQAPAPTVIDVPTPPAAASAWAVRLRALGPDRWQRTCSRQVARR